MWQPACVFACVRVCACVSVCAWVCVYVCVILHNPITVGLSSLHSARHSNTLPMKEAQSNYTHTSGEFKREDKVPKWLFQCLKCHKHILAAQLHNKKIPNTEIMCDIVVRGREREKAKQRKRVKNGLTQRNSNDLPWCDTIKRQHDTLLAFGIIYPSYFPFFLYHFLITFFLFFPFAFFSLLCRPEL